MLSVYQASFEGSVGTDQQRAAHPLKLTLGNVSVLCCSCKTSADVQLLPEERKVPAVLVNSLNDVCQYRAFTSTVVE